MWNQVVSFGYEIGIEKYFLRIVYIIRIDVITVIMRIQ